MTTLFPVDEPRRPPRLVLRPYQSDAVAAIQRVLAETSSCLAVLATGTGKTEIAAALIRAMGMEGSLFISPLIEITGQTAERLRLRGVQCGIEQGSLRSDYPVTVGCYASLLSRDRYRNYLGSRLVIVDESHLNYTSRALKMLEDLRLAGARIVGLTASPDRATGDPLSAWYGRVAYEYPYQMALRDGWLVPAKIWLTVLEDLDLSSLGKNRFADWDPEKLARLMAREKNVQAIASLIEQHYENTPSVVFCQSIQQSELLREVLQRRGISSAIVHSHMEDLERRQHLRDFEDRTTDLILNVGCLTLGWDWPPVRKLFIARPTKSKARYIQMFGRGTRPLAGVVDGLATSAQRRAAIAGSDKPHFEIFDVTDSSRHNDLQTAADVLMPDTDKRLLRRVRKKAEGSATALTAEDLDAVLEAERKALAAEEAALEALEASRRAGLHMDAKWGLYERDPLAAAERPDRPRRRWHMLFGKHKGRPLSQVPTGYLRWVLNDSNCRNKAFLAAVHHEVSKRGDAQLNMF